MVEYLRYVHGAYNALMMLLLFYQGSLGLRIRRARHRHLPFPMSVVRRHRKNGPVFMLLGVLGFLVGVGLILIDTGRVLQYPAHLFTGLAIAILLVSTYLVSRRIRGPASPLRTPHFVLGLAILTLYIVQVFLGLQALL